MSRLLPAFVALASCLAGASVSAAITLAPASPTPMDMITISKPFDNEDMANTVVSMSGNHVTVALRSAGAYFPEPPPGTLVQPIGRWPTGTYQIDVVNADSTPPALLVSLSVTVAPRAAGQPVDDYTDIWWNPNESGWGVNIAQHADGQLFATWLAYSPDGAPTWHVVPGGHWMGATQFVGDIYRTTGPNMLQFSAASVTRTKVGTASFFFATSGLVINFEIDGKQIVKTLQRQAF